MMKPRWDKEPVAKNEEVVLLTANGKEIVSRTSREFYRNLRKNRQQVFVEQFIRPIQYKEAASV